ncbi:mechanosensitive ion channel family protein [Corynebacterium doosanense]|uniref:mechanosensitive ion channel family protein n=1 Tax=Corynebacterium doosanense TaxID=1121358 RepID=UPI0003606A4D|nr:mechanosensitive ion channel family protein [Corynebacterium doosanense]
MPLPLTYLFGQAWAWLADTGINLAIIIACAFLIPRAGRFAERIVEREVTENQDENDTKASLAFAGVGIYVAQIAAYFLLIIAFLQQIGFSLAGAAIPATVVSAAIGFGAQSIIADFLAGFFVLSEKQYGVGDWVRFQGSGVEVEGSVISITMRATTIRTLAQETVTIPNSTAKVCVNTSNFWSRAVIVMPVPLLGSESPTDAVRRAEAATRRALDDEEIAPTLIGELDVHPATAITPPTTVGMPWTMDMRFMVQVEAGSQWLVERAVRLSILREFWDEYGSATTMTGDLNDRVITTEERRARHRDETPTTVMSTSQPRESLDSGEHDEGENPVPASLAGPDGADPAGRHPAPDSAADTPEVHQPATRGQRVRDSLRETRGSTGWLLGVLAVLLVVKMLFFSAEGEGGERVAGILAPPAPVTTEQTTEETVPESTESEPVSPTPSEEYPETTAPETTAPETPGAVEPSATATAPRPAPTAGTTPGQTSISQPQPTTVPTPETGAGTGLN